MDSKESIREMMYNSRMSQGKLALALGVRQSTVASYLSSDVRVGTLVKCAAATNHEIIIRNKKTSETWILTEAGDDE